MKWLLDIIKELLLCVIMIEVLLKTLSNKSLLKI